MINYLINLPSRLEKRLHPQKIRNSESEGQFKLISLVCLSLNYKKFCLHSFLALITGFLWGLILHTSPTLQAYFLYDQIIDPDTHTPSHCLVTNFDQSKSIIAFPIPNPDLVIIINLLPYIYKEGAFQPLQFIATEQYSQKEIHTLCYVSDSELSSRQTLYGKALIDIPMPGIIPFYAFELTRPFMFVQYFASILWVFERLMAFMVAMLAGILLVLTIKYIFRYFSTKNLNKFSRTSILVKVKRKNHKDMLYEQVINSEDLVPGDVIDIEPDTTLPVDLCLV